MNTSGVNPTVAWVCGTTLLLVVVAGMFVLSWHGTISGTDLIAMLGTVVGAALGMLGVHAGVTAGSRAAAGPPPTTKERA